MFREELSMLETLLWYSAMGINSIILDEKVLSNRDNIVHQTDMRANQQDQQESRKIADDITDLAALKLAVHNFTGCNLKKFAQNTVFADGVPEAKIMLVGEAPGANEDIQGVPFCGESGKLLDTMLKTIGLDRRTNIYITNTVFWRPPGNRAPTNEEVNICRPFVEKHIALIQPKLIILVGSVAATALLDNKIPITKLRRQYYQYHNPYLTASIATTAIFHPAYLLRQQEQKEAMWFDLLNIKQYLIEQRLA